MLMRSTLSLLAIVVSTPLAAQVTFTDVTEDAGLDDYEYSSPSAHSLGVNWIDYDNDGYPDLFLVGGGADNPPRLYHNEGDGTFTETTSLLPPLPEVEMPGSRFADYDNDGDRDLFVYTDSSLWDLYGFNEPDGPANLLLRNLWVENGGQLVPDEPLFEEVAAAAGLDDLAAEPFGSLPALPVANGSVARLRSRRLRRPVRRPSSDERRWARGEPRPTLPKPLRRDLRGGHRRRGARSRGWKSQVSTSPCLDRRARG